MEIATYAEAGIKKRPDPPPPDERLVRAPTAKWMERVEQLAEDMRRARRGDLPRRPSTGPQCLR